MSQENAKANNSETRKRILLGVLGAVLLLVLYLQFFSGGDDAPPPNRPLVATTGGAGKPSPTPALRASGTPMPIISQPLVPAWLGRGISGAGTGRNIFIYPTPTPAPTSTPAPPVPTPTPPPVTLMSLTPQGVIGRTGEFTLTVFGDKIPPDGQGFVEGRAYPTTIVGPTELKIKVPAEAIRAAGNLGVMVRSQSDAKMFSNQLSLNVAEPPQPLYRYVGIIVNKNGSMAVLRSQSDEQEVLNVTKGKTFGGHWRVVNITPQRIEVEDTNIKGMVHTINFTGEGG
jgi:hypothetical protein